MAQIRIAEEEASYFLASSLTLPKTIKNTEDVLPGGSIDGTKKHAYKWPCGVCGKTCRTNRIQCGHCLSWFHYRCEELTYAKLTSLGDVTADYVCQSCRRSFEFIPELSIQRLARSSSNIESLKQVAKKEEIFIRNISFRPGRTSKVKTSSNMISDSISMKLLESSGGMLQLYPIKATGDGNCLFNSLSIILNGDEALSSELRLRTCLEMISNADLYLSMHQKTGVSIVSPLYQEACQSCARDGGYSSAWTIQAAASVIGAPIISIYPPVNGMTDMCVRILNTTFHPAIERTKTPVYIMWTSTSMKSTPTWTPNHFVPLIRSAAGKTFAKAGSSTLLQPTQSPKSSSPVQLSPTPSPVVPGPLSQLPLPVLVSVPPTTSPSQSAVSSSISSPGLPSPSSVPSPVSPTTPSAVLSSVSLPAPPSPFPVQSPLPFSASLSLVPPSARSPDLQVLSPDLLSAPSTSAQQELTHVDIEIIPPDCSGPVKRKVNSENSEPVSSPLSSSSCLSPHPPSPRSQDLQVSYPDMLSAPSPSAQQESSKVDIEIIPPVCSRPVKRKVNSETSELMRKRLNLSSNISLEEYENLQIQLFGNKLHNSFLSLTEVYEIVCNETPHISEIPNGRKDNMYFVIDNSANIKNRKAGKCSHFRDDCGTWNNKASPTTTYKFILGSDGNLTNLKNKGGKYCSHNLKTKKLQQHDNIVILKRHYSKLSKDSSFKRRISWFEQVPNIDPYKLNTAVVEYLGQIPQGYECRGNCTKSAKSLSSVQLTPSPDVMHLLSEFPSPGLSTVPPTTCLPPSAISLSVSSPALPSLSPGPPPLSSSASLSPVPPSPQSQDLQVPYSDLLSDPPPSAQQESSEVDIEIIPPVCSRPVKRKVISENSELMRKRLNLSSNISLEEYENLQIQLFGNKLHNSFLSLSEVYEIVCNKTPHISEIPNGRKDNMYFVIDNSANIKNRKAGKRSHFRDDCGTWNNQASPTTTSKFILGRDGSLSNLKKKGGKYCSHNLKPKKFQQHDNIVILKRHYSKLSKDSSFKRRISWFEQVPNIDPYKLNTAVFEYLGKIPQGCECHGNCTKSSMSPSPVQLSSTSSPVVPEPLSQLPSPVLSSVHPACSGPVKRKVNSDNSEQMRKRLNPSRSIFSEEFKDHQVQPFGNRLNNSFLTVTEVYEIVCNETPHISEIPNGRKDNIYFVIDNSANIKNRKAGKCSQFRDDCGTWNCRASSTTSSDFILGSDGSLTCLKKKGEKYRPHNIEPQPNDNIVNLKRYYSTLMRDSSFKRRISWFERLPNLDLCKLNTAVVEYVNKSPQVCKCYGNRTKSPPVISRPLLQFAKAGSSTLLQPTQSPKSSSRVQLSPAPSPVIPGALLQFVTGDIPSEECVDAQVQPFGNRLEKGFLTVTKLYEIVCNETSHISEIPTGNKDNMYFIIDNSANIKNRKAGKRSDFTDDCGTWNRQISSTKSTYFIIGSDGSLTFLKKKGGKYYSHNRKPIEPQPNDNIVNLKRYYSTLMRDSSFKRRISWFERLPNLDPCKLNTAVVEYVNKSPQVCKCYRNRTKSPPVISRPLLQFAKAGSSTLLQPSQFPKSSSQVQLSQAPSSVIPGALSQFVTGDIPSEECVDPQVQPFGNRLEKGFLTVTKVYEIVCNETPHICEIPTGNKDNMYFIIDNSANIKNRKAGKRSDFTDDCGTWNRRISSTKSTYFIIGSDGSLTFLKKKGGKYYSHNRKPIEPQPKGNIVNLKRYYSTLMRDSSFKRRISWFEQVPKLDPCKLNTAVVEYLGKIPQVSECHGNRKHGWVKYVRSSKSILEEIRKGVSNGKPREVYENLATKNLASAPRNLKQVQNMKYAVTKKEKLAQDNTTDDVQSVINMIHENPFVQEIIQAKGKPPSIILYNEEQIKDMLNICNNDHSSSVVGIDRTYNLGSCFVTSLEFQHPNLFKTSTQTSPIMLGPIYLHWDCTYNTYHSFFSYLKSVLEIGIGDAHLGFGNLILGSSEEKAPLKAAKQCFPEATFVLCTRQLQESCGTYLVKKVGVDGERKSEILNDIFGCNGPLSVNDIVDYEVKVMVLSGMYEIELPLFAFYFRNTLMPQLRNYVVVPRLNQNSMQNNWKYNSCETMKHVMKLNANFDPSKLPDLVNDLHDIVQLQYLEMQRAMLGQGSYQLAPWVSRKFKIHLQDWLSKSDQDKKQLLHKFLSWCRKPTSSDGN